MRKREEVPADRIKKKRKRIKKKRKREKKEVIERKGC